jgi:hypothetical protein
MYSSKPKGGRVKALFLVFAIAAWATLVVSSAVGNNNDKTGVFTDDTPTDTLVTIANPNGISSVTLVNPDAEARFGVTWTDGRSVSVVLTGNSALAVDGRIKSVWIAKTTTQRCGVLFSRR